MNDFTKEELQRLEYALDNFIPTICNDEIENKTIDVLIKIQSMIDSYCEHESIKIEEERPHIKYT